MTRYTNTTRIPTEHKQVGFYQGSVMRPSSPYFAPPYPAYMREPGTNFVTIITAPGPHTTEAPGIVGGIPAKALSLAFHPQGNQPPLTHKGG
jgi:hypothetical protein